MNFKELNLTNTISSLKLKNGIQVKKWIPTSDKNDLIQIALQKAEEDGIYNEVKLDCYFHLNLIYLYTNIEFSEEDRKDEMKLYDILESNGIIAEVISVIGEEEYNDLFDKLNDMKYYNNHYRNTAAAVLRNIVQDLPKNAAAAKEIVDSFDANKYQEVIDFATAANGGRNINTQQDALKAAAQVESDKVVTINQSSNKD